jgi:hypothetical protein
MSDVVIFQSKAEWDAAENLRGFIESCRERLTVFGADLVFDKNVWDVTGSVVSMGSGNARNRLVFSTLASVKDAEPRFMAEPYLSFAKAYIRYMQGLRPTKNISVRLAALRSLEAALTESGREPDPVCTDMLVLNRAAQLIGEQYRSSTAYRIGGQLEMLAAFLRENKLTGASVRWRSPLQRPGDSVRVGKEFDQRRQDKLPSEAALNALPKAFRLATKPVDVVTSAVAAILCAAPDRINEVLRLPENCEVRQKIGDDNREVYGLRWWPAKGAEPMIKWIVPSMASVTQDAVKRIREVTKEARRIAAWYEDHPGSVYLGEELGPLRGKEWLSMREVADIVGLGNVSAASLWCKRHAVEVVGDDKRKVVRFRAIEKALLDMLPSGFPILDQENGLKYSEALLVVRINDLHPLRGSYRCMIEPITVDQINTALGGRVQHGFPSMFTRLDFAEPDGSPIKVTTHQFRHYLNTLAQAGGLSQLDIAKWSGRKDIRQNAAYDHVTPDQMLRKIRDAVGDDSQMFGALAEMSKKVLIPRDEFARLRVPTAHTTDFGFCIHDYTMSPCQLHRDCVHCEDLVCVKGDAEKTQRLRLSLEEARDLLGRAEHAVGEGCAGSDRWLTHHQSTVERLSQLCSIMDDPHVPLGAVIQLSPPRSAPPIEDVAKYQLPATGDPNILNGPLPDMLISVEGWDGAKTIQESR